MGMVQCVTNSLILITVLRPHIIPLENVFAQYFHISIGLDARPGGRIKSVCWRPMAVRQFFISLTIMTLRAAIYAAKAPNSKHFGDVFLSQQHQRKVIVDVGDLFYKFKLF